MNDFSKRDVICNALWDAITVFMDSGSQGTHHSSFSDALSPSLLFCLFRLLRPRIEARKTDDMEMMGFLKTLLSFPPWQIPSIQPSRNDHLCPENPVDQIWKKMGYCMPLDTKIEAVQGVHETLPPPLMWLSTLPPSFNINKGSQRRNIWLGELLCSRAHQRNRFPANSVCHLC